MSEAVTYKFERWLFPRLAKILPAYFTPDLLTGLALLAAVMGGVLYILAEKHPVLLLAINISIVIHWLADSLDGQVARTRRIERPRYGHYIDHMLDALSATAILGGLTTSSLTLTASWLWMLIVFLLLIVHVHLATIALGEFHLSLGVVGPTEARIALILVNSFIFFMGNPRMDFIFPATLFDWIGAVGATILFTVLLSQVVKTASYLNQLEQKKLRNL